MLNSALVRHPYLLKSLFVLDLISSLLSRKSLLKGEGKTEATDVTLGTAVADVPKTWIRDQIRDRLNLTQDISSMIDTQKHHCLLHHEVQSSFVFSLGRWGFYQSIVSLILAAFKPGLKREEDT